MQISRRQFVTGAAGLAAGAMISRPSVAADKKVIEIAGQFEPTISEVNRQRYRWIQGAIDQFEKEHPDFEVRYQLYGNGTIDTTIIRDHKTGIKHDVVMVDSSLTPAHKAAGSLMDLNKYYAQWSAADKQDLAWLPKLGYFNDGGPMLVIPAVVHARAIAYRTDLAKSAGIDFVNSPPETLDQLVDYAKKLTSGDVWGLGMYYGNHSATCECFFGPYSWYFGGDVMNADGTEATFANDAGVKTLQFFSDVINKYKVTAPYSVSGNYPDAIATGVFSGKYAMAESFGNYMFADLAASPYADKVSLFLPPLKQRFLNFWGVGVSSNTAYPDESARLLQLLMQPQNLIYFDYGLPVRQSAYQLARYKSPLYDLIKKSASTGRTLPPTINYYPLTSAVSAATQEAIVSKGSIPDILKKYQDDFNDNYGDS